MPSVEIVDMAGEGGPISRPLARAIEETKQAGGQSILFLNRRGFSWFFRCGTCGQEIRCKHCSVALTYHKERSSLECHYCGFRIPPPTACPSCGSLDTGLVGYGTERVEEEVRRRFPELRLGRLDADTVSRKGVLEDALADFRAGKIDILLGTQMVAKGLDFPSVMTIGIIHADSSLNLPDFRAAERTFALVVQVAGRAGRHRPDGRVFLQTCRPADPVILFAAAMDTEGFYSWELEQRRSLGFPPFSRLLRVVFRARDAAKAAKAAEAFGTLVRSRLQDGSEVLGPAPCPLGRIADTERIQVLLRGSSPATLRTATVQALSLLQPLSPVRVEIDVDPVSLL